MNHRITRSCCSSSWDCSFSVESHTHTIHDIFRHEHNGKRNFWVRKWEVKNHVMFCALSGEKPRLARVMLKNYLLTTLLGSKCWLVLNEIWHQRKRPNNCAISPTFITNCLPNIKMTSNLFRVYVVFFLILRYQKDFVFLFFF